MKNELDTVKQKIQKLNQDKENKIMGALESEEKGLSTELRKPRPFKRLTKFFSNRFNTYNVIIKSVILPINQKIEVLKQNELADVVEENQQEIKISDFENKIREIQNRVLSEEHKK